MARILHARTLLTFPGARFGRSSRSELLVLLLAHEGLGRHGERWSDRLPAVGAGAGNALHRLKVIVPAV